jgi:hypothetical protein
VVRQGHQEVQEVQGHQVLQEHQEVVGPQGLQELQLLLVELQTT